MQRRILGSACLRWCAALLLVRVDAVLSEECPALEGLNKEKALTAFKTLQANVKTAKQGGVEFRFTSSVGIAGNVRYEWDRPEWLYAELTTSIGGRNLSTWFTVDQNELLFAEQSCSDEKQETVHQRAIRVTNFRKLLGDNAEVSWQKGRLLLTDFASNIAFALEFFDLLKIADPEKLRFRASPDGIILEQDASDFATAAVRDHLLGGKRVPVVEFEMSKDGNTLRAIRMRPDPQDAPELLIEAKIARLSLEGKREHASVPLEIEPVAKEVKSIEEVTYDLITTQRFRTGRTP